MGSSGCGKPSLCPARCVVLHIWTSACSSSSYMYTHRNTRIWIVHCSLTVYICMYVCMYVVALIKIRCPEAAERQDYHFCHVRLGWNRFCFANDSDDPWIWPYSSAQCVPDYLSESPSPSPPTCRWPPPIPPAIVCIRVVLYEGPSRCNAFSGLHGPGTYLKSRLLRNIMPADPIRAHSEPVLLLRTP